MMHRSLRKLFVLVAEVARLQISTEFLRIQLPLFAMFAVWATSSSGATKITLRDKVEMTKYVVRLGDVAEIECDDVEQARELASLPLMPAPAAGSQRFLRKREIEDSLAAHGLDLQSVMISGATQTTVVGTRAAAPREDASGSGAVGKVDRRAALAAGRIGAPETMLSSTQLDTDGAEILNDGIRELIASYLKTKSAEAESCTVACQVPPRHLASLATATSRPVCQGGIAPWTGRQRFEVSFATAAGATKFFVHADVNPAATPVVIATRALVRGEVVTTADVELQDIGYVPKPNDRRVAARSIESLIGMEVRQPIPAGSMVFTDAVQPPVLVKRGELIHISSQSGGIRVRTTAKALQDCSQGQLVEVESLTTKQRFDARVVGPGQAVIATVATPAAGERTAPIETARLK
jgi:flagella basal body P-ring formation protein FlgA